MQSENLHLGHFHIWKTKQVILKSDIFFKIDRTFQKLDSQNSEDGSLTKGLSDDGSAVKAPASHT